MARKTKQIELAKEPENIIENKLEETPKAVAPAEEIFGEVGELVVDVFETGAEFVVLAAIAGVQIKDLDISLEKDMMVIKGNRCDPHNHPDKKYFYQECYWGPFSRKVILPENIDIDNADAQIDKGILTIKIPKNEAGAGKANVKIS
ncbi:MAG: Hsp20/alpha crystallin family protein [Candidatus Staskawiczbacteria bacterium]|nr:Hsp20/alpha crystallin family protein [Candidatus Staskawiczbacteria bacterium]